MDWLNKVIQIFKIKDLRNKILFVLAVFVVFRLMANIPIPGINMENLRAFFEQFQVFGILNAFTGGALDNLSIIMLGLGPYITSTIILQLLTMIFPKLEQMYKEEGEQGRQKFNQYGRILTVPLAMLQGFAMLNLLQRQGAIGSITPEVMKIILKWDPSQLPAYLLFFAMSLLIVAGVVMVNEARRNIPVSYAKRVRGQKMYGGVSTYLPLNINPAGVIPIIFALSILLFPGMIANFLAGAGGAVGNIAQSIGNFFQNPWTYGISYFFLVCVFTYFYTAVTFDPKNISSNLQKMGGFIPGIRPGQPTASFLYYILNRILLIGALFLGGIAVMPSIIQGATGITTFEFLVGGTSLLIVVSVVLETMRQIRSQLQMREYDTF
ncbi:MAG: preprotein translocase subunit SecY [Candidatus Nealsonbacteria bacterium]|nr:preprotein translocase subunit SecY [Candidatus Nealsonbacteria bacterium]